MLAFGYLVTYGDHMSATPSNQPWSRTRVQQLLGLEYPVIQGPFGNGLSSVELAATVAQSGGLGSFGANHLDSEQIRELGAQLYAASTRPIALNLWVSTHDIPESAMTPELFAAAVERLRPLYKAAGASPPPYPEQFAPAFEEQVTAVLEVGPAAFSFVFGVPDQRLLEAFAERDIVTIGTAITPAEAVALDEAGVNIIVASGMEAGGHRVAFLEEAEKSLFGTFALIGQTVDQVSAPIVAAGGIIDARGVRAAFELGAEGVQIGTGFLATEQSGATPEHRAVLFSDEARNTQLTRAFTGRLARGIPTRLSAEVTAAGPIEPYPYQGYLLAPILAASRAAGRTDLVSLWSGQSAPGLRYHDAREYLDSLTDPLSGWSPT